MPATRPKWAHSSDIDLPCLPPSGGGGFLLRLAKMEHSDNQRDSEKNRSAIQKPSARNAQIRGLFGSLPKAEDFFGDARSWEWQVWYQNRKNGAHEAHTLCICLPVPFQLRYRSNASSASKQALANNLYWRLACVAGSVGANGLVRPENNPKEWRLVPYTCWLQSSHVS